MRIYEVRISGTAHQDIIVVQAFLDEKLSRTTSFLVAFCAEDKRSLIISSNTSVGELSADSFPLFMACEWLIRIAPQSY